MNKHAGFTQAGVARLARHDLLGKLVVSVQAALIALAVIVTQAAQSQTTNAIQKNCLDLAENWPHQLTFDPQPIVVTAGSVVEVVATCVRREVTIELHAAAGATLPANCWLLLRALDHPVPHLDWTGAKVDDRGVARFRAAPPGRLRVELMTREQFAARDRDAAVPVGELAPGATSLRCTLPR